MLGNYICDCDDISTIHTCKVATKFNERGRESWVGFCCCWLLQLACSSWCVARLTCHASHANGFDDAFGMPMRCGRSISFWRAIFLRIFSFIFRNYVCFSGWVAFRLFGFCGFYLGFCGCYGFSFRILCIHSSSLSHPLHCQFRWLFGFVAFGGFLALAFCILCFLSWFLALASCILSITSSSLVPPATPLSIKIHA